MLINVYVKQTFWRGNSAICSFVTNSEKPTSKLCCFSVLLEIPILLYLTFSHLINGNST